MKSLVGMQVEIKPIDIKRGVRKNSCNCPVARSIRRQFKIPASRISVGRTSVLILKGAASVLYNFPASVGRFIDRFDEGQPAKPIAFKIGKEIKL